MTCIRTNVAKISAAIRATIAEPVLDCPAAGAGRDLPTTAGTGVTGAEDACSGASLLLLSPLGVFFSRSVFFCVISCFFSSAMVDAI